MLLSGCAHGVLVLSCAVLLALTGGQGYLGGAVICPLWGTSANRSHLEADPCRLLGQGTACLGCLWL